MNALKSIVKFVLYMGAVACCLAGLWVIYVAFVNFRELPYPQWVVVLFIEALFVCFAFTPAFMLIQGMKTKMPNWVFIGIVEAFVIGIMLCVILFFMAMEHRHPIKKQIKPFDPDYSFKNQKYPSAVFRCIMKYRS